MIKIEYRNINYASFFYVLLLAGFILISGLPYFFSVESRVITVPFRAFVLGVSILVIAYNFYFSKNNKFNISDYFFVLFWVVYVINTYLSFKNYEFSSDIKLKELEIYLRIIGVCFIPSLAILSLNPKLINYKLIFNVVYVIIFIILLANIIIGINYNYHGRSSGFLSTYSINFGHIGVTLAIMSLYNIMFYDKIGKYYYFLMIIGFLIGTYILYASSTRGPLIALIVVISYILYIKKKYRYLISLYSAIVLLIIGLFFLNIQNENIGRNSFFSRITKMIVTGDSSGRGKIYIDSIGVFLDKPLFGGRFLFFDGTYAHNFILDILMSTGLFGMAIFLVFFKNSVGEIIMIKKSSSINSSTYWVYLILIQYIVFAFFSCSLYDTPEFWYLIAMTMVLYKSKINERS